MGSHGRLLNLVSVAALRCAADKIWLLLVPVTSSHWQQGTDIGNGTGKLLSIFEGKQAPCLVLAFHVTLYSLLTSTTTMC